MGHFSTRASTNLLGALLTGGPVIALCIVSRGYFLPWSLLGVAAGLAGGAMQVASWAQSGERLAAASTAHEVRAAFSDTRWGRRYLRFFWVFALGLLLASMLLAPNGSGALLVWLTGYLSFTAAREAVCFASRRLRGSKAESTHS